MAGSVGRVSGESMDEEYTDWNEVKSRYKGNGKRNLSQDSGSDYRSENERVVRRKMDEDKMKILIKFKEGEDIKNVGLVALSRYLQGSIGGIEKAKILSDRSLVILCKNEGQRARGLQLKQVCKKEISAIKMFKSRAGVKGVIYGIPNVEDLGRLRENIKGGTVTNVRRLKTWRLGEKVDSMSVLLEFNEGKLPDSVFVGFMRYNVREYVPPPLRCYKCQKYGHIAAYCKGKQVCGRCGGEHEFGKCEPGAKLKCSNYGGDHSVVYRECEARKKAKEIQQTKHGKKFHMLKLLGESTEIRKLRWCQDRRTKESAAR
ncbi:uncharacterized protein LOC126397555 [Epinephelus moara]|uniref:uncharacterized protein LOC126397555 n=1 Tax=Epinephelus moara TaxID=300413 RepID=UPI00214EDF71|nr:uncharacterized protein LOC126397555 [Epinephelus moara]